VSLNRGRYSTYAPSQSPSKPDERLWKHPNPLYARGVTHDLSETLRPWSRARVRAEPRGMQWYGMQKRYPPRLPRHRETDRRATRGHTRIEQSSERSTRAESGLWEKNVPPPPMAGAEDVGITSSLRQPSLVSSSPSLPPVSSPLPLPPPSLPWCPPSVDLYMISPFLGNMQEKSDNA